LWQDRPPEEVIRTAEIADSLAYPSIWIGEMATWDVFALGAHLASRLKHSDLVLGPLAVSVRDPVMIAMGTASVAALTDRRVAVGLGTSSTTVVEKWHGRSRLRPALALGESAAAVRSLLDGEKVTQAGQVVSTDGYRLRLTPPGSELVIAAFGPGAIRVAARYGDRMVLNLIDPPSARSLVGELKKAAVELGRTPPRVAVWATCAVDPGAMAKEQMRRAVVGYLSAPGYSEIFSRAGFADVVQLAMSRPHPSELLARVPAEINQVTGLVGDAEQVRSRIGEYFDAGVDDVVIVPAATDEDPAGERTLRAVSEIAAGL
jgi:probable F420-dependent oxidoreductase